MSLGVYSASILIFHNYFNLDTVDGWFFIKIGIITGISWAPIHITKKVIEKIDPNPAQKI